MAEKGAAKYGKRQLIIFHCDKDKDSANFANKIFSGTFLKLKNYRLIPWVEPNTVFAQMYDPPYTEIILIPYGTSYGENSQNLFTYLEKFRKLLVPGGALKIVMWIDGMGDYSAMGIEDIEKMAQAMEGGKDATTIIENLGFIGIMDSDPALLKYKGRDKVKIAFWLLQKIL